MTQQAAQAGYSTQLLLKHMRAGRISRVRRSIYRLIHFPAGEREELVVAWLWSKQAGIISHQTALALQNLSDVLPAQIHLTLPYSWRNRRLKNPTGIVFHYANVPQNERTWFGAVPVTDAKRSLSDCARNAMAPDLLYQAIRQALHRGLIAKNELEDAKRYLKPFGGIGA